MKQVHCGYCNIPIPSSLRTTDIQPKIISVSEVKPNNFTRTPTEAEYEIDGYEMESLGLGSEEAGRGMIVYLHKAP